MQCNAINDNAIFITMCMFGKFEKWWDCNHYFKYKKLCNCYFAHFLKKSCVLSSTFFLLLLPFSSLALGAKPNNSFEIRILFLPDSPNTSRAKKIISYNPSISQLDLKSRRDGFGWNWRIVKGEKLRGIETHRGGREVFFFNWEVGVKLK